MAPISEVMM
jgi:hypothetical protein